jgi:hypothetical protein
MAAIVCSVLSEPAIPRPSETTRKEINGCSFRTEMRVTKTRMAMPMRSQMDIYFRNTYLAKLAKAGHNNKLILPVGINS